MDNPEILYSRIEDFCLRWNIIEFALFGSHARGDMRPDSDVDFLVSFAEDSQWSLFDWVRMEDELREMFGREVDMVSRSGLRNPFRRHEILRSRKVIYAASSA